MFISESSIFGGGGVGEGVGEGVGVGEDVGHGFVAGQLIVEELGHEPPCWAGLVVVQVLLIVDAPSPHSVGHLGFL